MDLLDYKEREAKLLVTGCEIRITRERRQEKVVPDPTSIHEQKRNHLVKKIIEKL